MFGSLNKSSFQSIYVVLSLPRARGVLQHAVTFKVGKQSGEVPSEITRALHNHYWSSHVTLKTHSQNLGEVRQSLWDLSAPDWDDYSKHCQSFNDSCDFLAAFSKIRKSDVVLDLSCGTGAVIGKILDRATPAKIVALDASAQMIKIAEENLAKHRGLQFAVCDFLSCNGEVDWELSEDKFSLICIHQSMPQLSQSVDLLRNFARRCERRLAPNGRVVLAMHNGAIKIPFPNGHKSWRDEFRIKLAEAIRKAGHENCLRNPPAIRFTIQDIESAFAGAGLRVKNGKGKVFPNSKEDRLRLWRSPAVLDSFLDVRKYGMERSRALVEKVFDSIQSIKMPPMMVKYWEFKK